MPNNKTIAKNVARKKDKEIAQKQKILDHIQEQSQRDFCQEYNSFANTAVCAVFLRKKMHPAILGGAYKVLIIIKALEGTFLPVQGI